ncbi:MAG TPA: DEAD/DEAH box helicase [Terriglobales bacterium]|nr:DEAD/DEAH box helicase [Terriglobales bacterium]
MSPGSDMGWAHPLVREWFLERFGSPTEPQEQGWPHILAGHATLISAPTGSGKTLAAFLACIDRLVRKALAGNLHDRTEVLYISPLKALGNDIQKNLEVPLGEILQRAGERGLLMPEIRTAVRTGDTLAHERRAMLRRPPHILVTTPESLYILLTAEGSRAVLKDVETVIVDEIHAVADDKRGAHLSLSLERLEALTKRRPVRIGLSATQKPIELVAQFLAGSERPLPAIVNIGHRRAMDLGVEVPGMPLGPVASNEMWDELYDRIAELVGEHRSTLLFVNTRRLAERVSHNLVEKLGEEAVAAHHGSLSRKLRLAAEKRLKEGQAKVVVATASLELGIDIGTVDLVCQIGSPRAIAVALQRAGRSGHWRGAVPKARFFVTTRDELVECAALVRSIRLGELDRLEVPDAPLDILAQQLVAASAVEDWREDDLYALARRAYPYRELGREEFDAVLEMLGEGVASRRGRYGAYLHRDRVHGRVKARRGGRLAAITSGGAIPDNALYSVIAEPEGTPVGTVDEDFAVESMKGDIMLLGNTSWRIRRIESTGRVLVEDAHGAPPNIPFWRGEAPARTAELSAQVAELRERVSEMVPERATQAVEWLKGECGLDDAGAEQIVAYIVEGRAVLGAVPTQTTIIAERFFDEGGGMQLVIHAPFGGRINKAWGLALRKRFCRSFNFELQAAATDEGLNIALAEQHSFPLADVFQYLHVETVKEVLEQAALASPIFAARWRWDAMRSLALLRFSGGRKVPPQIQRMRSDDLLASVFPDVAACQENITGDIRIPDHPLVREVMKDVLTEALDLEGLRAVLRGMASGAIRTLAVDTVAPSAFSHQILNANPYAFLDDAPLEERRARAVEMRRVLPDSVLAEVGRLDPAAIAQVREDAWPEVRDADELHDALYTLLALPEETRSPAGQPIVERWGGYFDTLVACDRAGRAVAAGRAYWVATERARTFAILFPEARFERPLPEIAGEASSRDDALLALVTGWMQHSGPTTSSELALALGLEEREVEQQMLRLEAAGTILRGSFRNHQTTPSPNQPIPHEWCDRRLLARIHQLTLGTLRKQIEPVTAAQFLRWLLRWQHLADGAQLRGERGVLEAVRQLQGFEIPANAWEPQVLARRVAGYDPKALDQLCLTGAVGWGRLSPHPATLEDSAAGRRRVVPTSVAPITFFVREEADWMLPRRPEEDQGTGLSHGAQELLGYLRQRGASFFADLVRGTGRLKAEVETALWELVAAGLVTADGFDNLRALIDPKRRSGHGAGRVARPRHSTGRWSLLYAGENADRVRAVEATCRMLLQRYGVVFRDLLARETIVPKWRELLDAFRRLEARGEVRGGRFVSGFLGEQFALPVAVDSLRATRKLEPSGETIVVSAADPLNLVGILVPGERVPAVSGRFVTYCDGVPVEAEARESGARAGD